MTTTKAKWKWNNIKVSIGWETSNLGHTRNDLRRRHFAVSVHPFPRKASRLLSDAGLRHDVPSFPCFRDSHDVYGSFDSWVLTNGVLFIGLPKVGCVLRS